MFNPTKAHEKWVSDNQYKIRMGNRVPKDAVSLAYTYVPPLNAKENVQVADMSGFVLENITSTQTNEKLMYPNDAYLLEHEVGGNTINSRSFLMTNIFDTEKPLYYMYETKYEIIDSEGPDVHGVYQGSSISLIDRLGQKLSSSYSYKIMLSPTDVVGRYKVRIFTAFLTQPSDNIKVIYTAVQDDKTVPGYTEAINPQPAFRQEDVITDVISNPKALTYYQSSGLELGESHLTVSQRPLRNSDYRTPVKFNFSVTAHYTDGTNISSPVYADEVYHADSVTEADSLYYNGFKRLFGWIAEDFLTNVHVGGPSLLDPAKIVDYYSVSSDNISVEVYTQPDGQNYVLASTQVDTGKIVLPGRYRVAYRNNDTYYEPAYSVRLNDNSQIKVLNPIQTDSHESWFLRVKNGRFKKQATSSAGFPVSHLYSIPEYYTQQFDAALGIPYRQIQNERPIVIGERKIKVRYTPLYVVDNNVSVTVNSVPAAIKAWNSNDGTFELDMKIKENDVISVNYFYEEQTFTYRGYWDEKNQRFWGLDLNPSQGHMYTDVNAETGDIIDVPSFGLINKTIHIYIKPSATYNQEGTMIRGSYQSHVIFHTFQEINDKQAILISKIRIRPNSSIDSIKIVDTRKRGGGLKEGIGKELMKELAPDSQYYWDIGFWDGEPYSENGVVVIRLPRHILKENGGRFTGSEVQAIVKRHLGFGNLPLIEFVDEPVRLLGAPVNTTLDIIKIEG